MVGPHLAGGGRIRECLQLAGDLGEDEVVNNRLRFLVPLLILALTLVGCGDDGESPEQRAEVVELLERLAYGPRLADCMAEEFDGTVTAEQLQTVIDARGELANVDFELTETIVRARDACQEDEG